MGFCCPRPKGKFWRQRFGEKGKRSFIKKLHNQEKWQASASEPIPSQGSPTTGPQTDTGPWPVRKTGSIAGGELGRGTKTSLSLPPELCLLSPAFHGKIVFHETGPWCQKGWVPMQAYRTRRGKTLPPSAKPIQVCAGVSSPI